MPTSVSTTSKDWAERKLSSFSFWVFSAGRCPLCSCNSSLDGALGHCRGRLYNILILYCKRDEVSQWYCVFTPWCRYRIIPNKARQTRQLRFPEKQDACSAWSNIRLNAGCFPAWRNFLALNAQRGFLWAPEGHPPLPSSVTVKLFLNQIC